MNIIEYINAPSNIQQTGREGPELETCQCVIVFCVYVIQSPSIYKKANRLHLLL